MGVTIAVSNRPKGAAGVGAAPPLLAVAVSVIAERCPHHRGHVTTGSATADQDPQDCDIGDGRSDRFDGDRWPVVYSVNPATAVQEAGANPARSRHCNRVSASHLCCPAAIPCRPGSQELQPSVVLQRRSAATPRKATHMIADTLA